MRKPHCVRKPHLHGIFAEGLICSSKDCSSETNGSIFVRRINQPAMLGANQRPPNGEVPKNRSFLWAFLGVQTLNSKPWQRSSSARNHRWSCNVYIPLGLVVEKMDPKSPNFRTCFIQNTSHHCCTGTSWGGQPPPSDHQVPPVVFPPSCMTLASRMGSMGGFVACAKS